MVFECDMYVCMYVYMSFLPHTNVLLLSQSNMQQKSNYEFEEMRTGAVGAKIFQSATPQLS